MATITLSIVYVPCDMCYLVSMNGKAFNATSIVLFDDTKEDGKKYPISLPKDGRTTLKLYEVRKPETIFVRKRIFHNYHYPFQFKGEYGMRLYIPLSQIEFEYKGEVEEECLDGDMLMVYDKIWVAGEFADEKNGKDFLVSRKGLETEQYKERTKLLEELREAGAYAIQDYELKKILKKYTITRKE